MSGFQLDEKRKILSGELCRHLLGLEVLTECAQLGLFMGRDSEPDLGVVASKKIAVASFPRVEGESMVFYSVSALDELKVGYCGILEPPPIATRRTEFVTGGVILVPGGRFDRLGGRQGSGRGFYDRFLALQQKDILKIGIAWDEQVSVEALELKPHDVRMDLLCTPSGFIRW